MKTCEAVLALLEEKGKKHARGNVACVGEPLVGVYKELGRGKYPAKGQDVSHRVSLCVTICSLHVELAIQHGFAVPRASVQRSVISQTRENTTLRASPTLDVAAWFSSLYVFAAS
jgi:hypothetical protein